MARGGFTITVEGDKALLKALARANVKRGEIRAISRRAGNIIKNASRKKLRGINFENSEGNLAESIIVKSNKRFPGVVIVPNYDKGEAGSEASDATSGSYFHLQAFEFVRSKGGVTTRRPIGQVIQEAAAFKKSAISTTLAKGYGTLLRRKLRKL